LGFPKLPFVRLRSVFNPQPLPVMKSLFVSALFVLAPVLAQAQIGSGWREYKPSKTLQKENSENHSSLTTKDGVETFKLWKNPASGLPKNGRQRIEWRVNDNYTRGSTQFQGEFYVVKGGGPTIDDDVCIMQVWLSLIVSVSDVDGGTLKAGRARIKNIKNKWVRLNVTHNADNNTVAIYLDGNPDPVWSGSSKDSNPFYHKYGLYNEADARPEVHWRNVRYFTKGNTGL
jgi:hypothetical protein